MLNLQAVDLSKTYRGRKVVDDVELEIGQGEVVGLLGPNGAGKTTTFYIMVGLTRPDSGRVLLNGEEITDLPMYLRARSGISYLPQEPSVFRQLTSEENLLAVLETLPLTPEQQRDRLEELIVQMGLETVRTSKAYVLSGGERRRLEIARSLTLSPSFILLKSACNLLFSRPGSADASTQPTFLRPRPASSLASISTTKISSATPYAKSPAKKPASLSPAFRSSSPNSAMKLAK